MSIDEFSMSGRNFKTTIVDTEHRCLLDVIDSHKQDEIIEALQRVPCEVRERVKSVSVDMWAGFKKVVATVFPRAAIVIDRFHVVKQVTGELKKICRQSGLRRVQEQSLLLKNGESLHFESKEKLASHLRSSGRLRKAYEYKEQLREIYQTSVSVEEGRARMKQWLAAAQEVYGKAIGTIGEHFAEVCNYFIAHHTSGVTEGINTKIKLIKRQGYGYTNFGHLRLRLLAGCGVGKRSPS